MSKSSSMNSLITCDAASVGLSDRNYAADIDEEVEVQKKTTREEELKKREEERKAMFSGLSNVQPYVGDYKYESLKFGTKNLWI